MILGIIFLINLIIVFCLQIPVSILEKIFISAYTAIVARTFFLTLSRIIKNYKESRKWINIIKEDENKFLYYREIIKNISIAELGYLYKKNINIELLIGLTIQKLLLNKNIEINENKIKILSNRNLFPIEEYMVKNIKFWDLPEFKRQLKKEIKRNLIKQGYMQTKEKNLDIKDFLIILLGAICFFVSITLLEYSKYIFLYIMLFVIYWLVAVIHIRTQSSTMYLVTSKGVETYQKLKGLKKYLQDYTEFSEKEIKELVLWREYMLYAILLDESDKLEKEVKLKYNEIIDFLQSQISEK
ncbi:MAG: DUF2207 domain-containing protein [Clostridia bacterium]|nr:DUF2207 domain-containing protein [Clostridia bacterium]